MKKGTDRQSLCAEAIIEGVEANLQNLMQVYDQLHYIDPRFAYDRMRFDRAGLEKAAAWIKDRIERTDEAEDIFYDWCFYSRDGIVAKAKNMTEPGARRRALEEYLAIPSAERPEATFRIECVVWEQYEYRLPDDAKEYETYEEARKALVDYLMKKHPSDEYVYINAALKGSGAYEQTREGIFLSKSECMHLGAYGFNSYWLDNTCRYRSRECRLYIDASTFGVEVKRYYGGKIYVDCDTRVVVSDWNSLKAPVEEYLQKALASTDDEYTRTYGLFNVYGQKNEAK